MSKSCYHCTFPFNSNICHVPVKRYGDRWTVTGAFCSLSCALRFVIDTKLTSLSMFSNYVNHTYGSSNIVPAKSRYTLSKFTDNGISIEEFRLNANLAPFPQNDDTVVPNMTPDITGGTSNVDSVTLYPSKGIIPLSTLLKRR